MNSEVFVYYWNNKQMTETKNWYTEIRMYGLNESNETVCVRVTNFMTKIYLDFIDSKYVEENEKEIMDKLKSILYDKKSKDSIKIVEKKRLYWAQYDENKRLFPFIEISFNCRISMFSFRKKIKTLSFKYTPIIQHDKVSPELQLMTDRNLDSCGWICLKDFDILGRNDKDRVTICDYEILISYKNIFPSKSTKEVDMKIMSWDIEANCENISTNPGNGPNDCVFQISCVFYTLKSEIKEKVLLTLGKCSIFDNDTEIREFSSERDLILGFSDIITEKRPNILTGWNILNFDIKFMLFRAEANLCKAEFLDFGWDKDPGELQSIRWESKASALTDVMYIDATGILSIDLIEVVRKEYNFESYTLNYVSKHFLGDHKDDVTLSDIISAYNSYLNNSPTMEKELTRIGKYCVQDSNLVIDLFIQLQTWLSLSSMAIITSTQIINVHLRGQQQKFYNLMYKVCVEKNIVVESGMFNDKNLGFTGATVMVPIPGIYDNVVPFDFNSLYPTSFQGYNVDYTTIVPDDMEVPDNMVEVFEWEDHEGCEHDPLLKRKLMLDNLIKNISEKIKQGKEVKKLLDNKKNSKNLEEIQRLTKTLENISLDKLIKTEKKYAEERRQVVKQISGKIKCIHNRYRFLKKEVYEGVIPSLINGLLEARKQVRKEMASVQDQKLRNVLNKRQLSYKITANSIYGATGVKEGSLPFMPLAICVTYIGRRSIRIAAKYIEEKMNGKVIYGDTDSTYVVFNEISGKTNEETCNKLWEKAIYCSEKVSCLFPNPMKIAFEEVIYRKFLIITKKCYMYYETDRDGKFSDKLKYKGVLLARRDSCNFIKKVYEASSKNIMNEFSHEEVIEKFTDQVLDLLVYHQNPEDFKISKSINNYNGITKKYGKWYMGNYVIKEPPNDISEEERLEFCKSCLPAQVQLELSRLKEGKEKSQGSRIEFVNVRKITRNKTQADKIIEFKNFLDERKYNIDSDYYLDRLRVPIEKLFETAYKSTSKITSVIDVFYHKNKVNDSIKSIFSTYNLN
jgi:DNA polymerase elongation subunit (family B)